MNRYKLLRLALLHGRRLLGLMVIMKIASLWRKYVRSSNLMELVALIVLTHPTMTRFSIEQDFIRQIAKGFESIWC